MSKEITAKDWEQEWLVEPELETQKLEHMIKEFQAKQDQLKTSVLRWCGAMRQGIEGGCKITNQDLKELERRVKK